MNNYENLIKEKETLENRLAIITKELQALEKVVYKGKAEKIITLMTELIPFIGEELFNEKLETLNSYGEWEVINYTELCDFLKKFFIEIFKNY